MATIIREDDFDPSEWDLITNDRPEEYEYEDIDSHDFGELPFGEQLESWEEFAGTEDD